MGDVCASATSPTDVFILHDCKHDCRSCLGFFHHCSTFPIAFMFLSRSGIPTCSDSDLYQKHNGPDQIPTLPWPNSIAIK